MYCAPSPVRVSYANASRFKVQAAYQCSLVLRSLIRPHLLRRTKADVELKLPDKSEQVRCSVLREARAEGGKAHAPTPHTPPHPPPLLQVLLCSLSQEQRDAYERFVRSDLVLRVLAGKCNAFVALTSLQKICNHPHLHMWDCLLYTSPSPRDS